MSSDEFSRRRFLRYLAGSPLFATSGIDLSWLEQTLQQAQEPAEITSAAEAINVFDFEPVARRKIPHAHWGYLMTGTDDDATIAANRAGYAKWDLRARRLVDISKIDTSITLIGTKWQTPIFICPVGSQKAFHAEGEIAVARAAKAKGHLQILSTVATSSIEDVIAARGAPVWYQLYHRPDWNETKQMLKRAEHAGAPAVVFTVDLIGGSNRETLTRMSREDTRQCTNCHAGGAPTPGRGNGGNAGNDNRRKPMLAGLEAGPTAIDDGTPTWDYIKRIRDFTTMKVFVKGIVTREDAGLAVQHGVSGVIVSNHGGRAENSTRATIAALPEVVAGARGRIPVLVDGGVRRGTDVFKALALGATAVGIGRPYIWGLGSFGQEGVEAVLAILRRELAMTMRQMGIVSVQKITPSSIIAHGS